jgi:recombination associated protein RdgC
MWFKQAQVYTLQTAIPFNPTQLADQLAPWIFTPCLPSFPASLGWVSPLDEDDAPLVHAMNGKLMICLQFEEKLLPAVVINQTLKQQIHALELQCGRKLPQKEKLDLKDEIIHTLLPRAFTKLSRVHAYIDTKHNQLILDTISAPRIEKFIDWLKKSFSSFNIQPAITKFSSELTRWLSHQDYPQEFSIEKACVLSDPREQQRVIRCQQQDLSAQPIQLILKDGCQVNQLALAWNDQVKFTLTDEGALRSIKYPDEIVAQAKEMEPETKRQQFEADFLIMGETLSGLINALLTMVSDQVQQKPVQLVLE